MDWTKMIWRPPDILCEIEEAGDDGIVCELIASFQSDTANRFARLHHAASRLDTGPVGTEAHSIRGSARQMGAGALAILCLEVEAGAPRRDWPELEHRVNRAEAGFDEVSRAMSDYLKDRQFAG